MTGVRSLSLLARGKVRDNHAIGDDQILMIASDRLSAFDVMLGSDVPDKGVLLTQMSLFWFAQLRDVCPNHLTGESPEAAVLPDERAAIAGRAMRVRRLAPIAVEAVVRGYLAGSGWDEYQRSRSVCGVPLPAGLQLGSRLPEPIFTPVAKAPFGEHDVNITQAELEARVGVNTAQALKDTSLALYRAASAIAERQDVLIADTKFEFGHDAAGRLVLMDEVLTPDSSRFWPRETWTVGRQPPGYDKQQLRDWLSRATIDGRPWNKLPPAPALPPDIVDALRATYMEAYRRITGQPLALPSATGHSST